MVDVSELEDLVNKLQDKSLLIRAASNSLYNATEKQSTFTAKNTHFKQSTGATLAALDTSVKGLSSSIFVDSAKVPYIEPLYNGSKPHIITPKSTNALSFVIGNARFFAKEVHHPGYKGNPFILDAYNKNREKFFKFYSKDMTEQIQDALE